MICLSRRLSWVLGALMATTGALAVPAATSASASAVPSVSAHPTTVEDDAAADLRRLSVEEEIFLTDYGFYGNFQNLVNDGLTVIVSPYVTLRIVHYHLAAGYCLSARTSTGEVFVYDSQAGGLLAGSSCTVTVSGPSGGTMQTTPALPLGPSVALSNLAELAHAEAFYLYAAGRYGTYPQLIDEKADPALSPGVTAQVVWIKSHVSYCLKATVGGTHRYYASARDGIQPIGQTCSQRPHGATSGGPPETAKSSSS
jgi:hypothetical protein